MSPRRANRRRAIGALVPLILTASLLSGDFVFAQNSPNLDEISLTAEQILPTARVAVLGDGLLSSPAIAPLQPNGCQTSTNGPVERAARRSPETVVLVQNESCVGASLSSIGSEQVGKLDPRTDVVVVGGVGIEFDWPTLAAVCLHPETRTANGCQSESGLARATAANSFFAWRSLIRQVHSTAPDATIVIVAPPLPVSGKPLRLGSNCCLPSTDGRAQVRSVFDTARALRGAVVESVSDLPIVLVETDRAFAGHLMEDEQPWLTTAVSHPGTPTEQGADAIADLIEVLMPIGAQVTAPAAAPAEVVMILGTTNADESGHEVLRDHSEYWMNTYRLANANASVAVVPVRTSEPIPPVVADDSAPQELDPAPVERVLDEEVPGDLPAVADDSAPRQVVPPAVGQALPATGFTRSAQDLADLIGELETTNGVSSIADLNVALSTTAALLSPAIDDQRVIIRAVELDLTNATETDRSTFRETLLGFAAEVTIIAGDPDQAAALAELTTGTGVIIDSASSEELTEVLPAPVAEPQLLSISAPDVDIVADAPAFSVAAVEVARPTDATVSWTVGDTVVAQGQNTTIDPERLGIGTHQVTVSAATDRETISTTMMVRISVDGDGRPDDSCDAFDPFPTDVDNDGQAAACDSDDDDDTIPDALDPCPSIANTNLADVDLDGIPNRCDADSLDGPRGDTDGDGFPDLIDNCPSTRQANQFDADADGLGNACEAGTLTLCTITGTADDDVLRGTPGDDVICGLGGDDRITGFAGNDTILGGPGNDELYGSGGNDTLIGGPGNDQLYGNGDDDIVRGDAGDDVLDGGFGADVISGGGGNDIGDGGAGADAIFGGGGNDVLRGGDGPDAIAGDAGTDELFGEAGTDILDGGAGKDQVRGGKANDRLVNVGPNDFARGGTGDDLIDATPIRIT